MNASRIPDGPYPGLRPFLEHEEILLFGRERQVREVLERLRQTQFVAVLGGSGSGKSSLVLAGVVPELRSFGIPGAGDFWLPLVCTPGTNASSEDQAQRLDTPITRLARRFATLLRSRGSAAQDEARLAEIAARLREELGFSTLLDLYTDELAAPPGPDPKDARILIVIDQFEELFHPTTRNGADTRLLVERVIDHFFSPHPRCYIVLTMRSEHLNDCAAYLELPDAINKASYLVRRLDDEELSDAITQPAQRLLRLRQLAEDDAARLPESMAFDDAVVARLLRDARSLSDDPDHLPLLQHALARTWDAATARVSARLDLPDRIEPADLAVAAAGAADTAAALDADVNVLIASLENWAEAAYRRLAEPDRAGLDAVLRRLAVKDPNTGMYSQQRIHVDDAARLLGPGRRRDDLRALLADGFIGNVDYLYWDDGDPERVTLKVSHESFIRGWKHLRGLIDAEADRFAEFVELLRKCEAWRRGGGAEGLLLEGGDLRRVESAGLPALLASRGDRAEWFRRLGATRAYSGLHALGDGGAGSEVDRFLARSMQRQQAVLADVGRRQRQRRLVWFAGGVVLPLLFYFTVVQVPVVTRSEFLVQAAQKALGEPTTEQSAAVGGSNRVLERLIEGAQLIESGRQGQSLTQRLNRWVLDKFAAVPVLSRRAGFVMDMAAVTEPVVNERLRSVLQSALWAAPDADAGVVARYPATQGVASSCADAGGASTDGTLFSYRDEARPQLSRSLFLVRPGPDEGEGRFALYTVDPALEGGGCRMTFLREWTGSAAEGAGQTDVAFDARLRHVFITGEANYENQARIVVYEIRLEVVSGIDGNADTRQYTMEATLELTDEADVRRLRSAVRPDAGSPQRQVLDTWRTEGGWAFVVGDATWRMFGPSAEFLEPADASKFDALLPAMDDSTDCGRLGEAVRDSWQGFAKQTSFHRDPRDDAHCFLVVHTHTGYSRFDDIDVGVYARPSKASLLGVGDLLPAPVVWLPRFTRVPSGDDELTLHIGKGGRDGWLAASAKTLSGAQRLRAGPWSTCALARLGVQVLPPEARRKLESLGPEDHCRLSQPEGGEG